MDKKEMLEYLKQLDRDFCELCQEKGALGWIEYFSEDAMMISSGSNENYKGKDEILFEMEKLFSLDSIDFRWEPNFADISDDFTMGITSGTYTKKYKIGNVSVEQKGKYTTLWKKINDEYKITLDIGN